MWCLQRHYVTSTAVSPSFQRNVHRNMSAPSSPVHTAKSEHRTPTSRVGDGLHHPQPSFPVAETTRIHASVSDHGRHVDTRYSDPNRDSGYSDRSRVDHKYADYAYISAAAVTRPQMTDPFVDYRAGGNRGADSVYMHQSHWTERPRDVQERVKMDGNLYHIASNRTVSYASSDEGIPLPVTAAATSLRFLDPTPHWPSKHGSLETSGYWSLNGDTAGNPNLRSSGSSLGVVNLPYGDNNTRLPERSYDVGPPRQLGSPHVHYETPPHVRAAAAETSYSSVELSPVDPSTVVMRGQNYVEVSKPFEMADVYKYSSRVWRTAADGVGDWSMDLRSTDLRSADLRSTSSPHLTTCTREPQYRDQRPAYVAPSPQYVPSRQYRKPVFD